MEKLEFSREIIFWSKVGATWKQTQSWADLPVAALTALPIPPH